jgi:hypothetical protein
MIPLLFAAALTLSGSPLDAAAPSPIVKDLRGPVQHPLDAPIPAPLSRDLRGPVPKPLDAPKPSFVVKIAPTGQPGLFGKPLLDAQGNLVTCNRPATRALDPGGHNTIQKLGDLPPGVEEHAVLRMINGCPVREIVYAGQTYYLDAPTGGLERVNPTAYRTVQH